MGQKDLGEKQFLDYNDVFADVSNVLVFQDDRIREEELLAGPTESVYKKKSGDYTSQNRDIAKYWQRENVTLALFAVENQTETDRQMPLRMIGYDGAAYRSQYGKKDLYPVVSLVLNFGDKRWEEDSKSLYQILPLTEELKPFVSDYRINVVDVAYLEEEIRNRFTSDFKIIADFFYHKRTGEKITADERVMRHPLACIDFFRIFTNDEDYAIVREAVCDRAKKGEITMCTFLDECKRLGREEGEERLAALINKLVENNLSDQIVLVTTDKEVRSEMYQRYHL